MGRGLHVCLAFSGGEDPFISVLKGGAPEPRHEHKGEVTAPEAWYCASLSSFGSSLQYLHVDVWKVQKYICFCLFIYLY